ncbi:MAG TPA: hypothetical protein VGX92_21130 [Pyrinomonadaceae bacterium]|jgi:hypothetical protein|nr:hypothetical protein [Pyrinomonadaceae bacterium]
MGQRIKIYDEHKRPIGTAVYEFDEEAPLSSRTTLDGAPVHNITSAGDGWSIYWVNWRDKNTGQSYSSVYVKDE